MIDALDIALNAIDTEKPNELIDVAKSFDEIYEEINDFKPMNGQPSTNGGEKVLSMDIVSGLKSSLKSSSKSNSNSKSKLNSNPNPKSELADEPYYQVPKKHTAPESYYEVPTSRPIPVYENVDMYYDNTASENKFVVNTVTPASVMPIEIGNSKIVMQPPKEKPPPPPVDAAEPNDHDGLDEEPLPQDAMKRINSTKRIKKDIRNKRSSFLGIEGNHDEENFLELGIAPPPDMVEFIKEERRFEKQMYIKAGLYDSSDTAESRDSGVSENHSRQSSEPVTSSSEEQEQENSNKYLNGSRPEIISALEKDKKLLEAGKNALAMECRVLGTQQWVYNDGFLQNGEIDPILKALDEKERARCIEEQIREEEEVLRVERELLQLEQEELKRQRENMMNRKMYEQRIQQQQVEHRRSLQDINANGNLYANVYNGNNTNSYHVQTDHRKSMPNLQEMTLHELEHASSMEKLQPPIPPAKPLRVQEYLKYSKQIYSNGNIMDAGTNQSMPMHLNAIHSHSNEEFLPYVVNNGSGGGSGSASGGGSSNNSMNGSQQYGNMTRHTLQALSAAPKPKFQDAWVQQQSNANNNNNNYENTNDWHTNRNYIDPAVEPYIRSRQKESITDSWTSGQQKRRSDPNFNYNKHWLIQEAEQRRIDQARSSHRQSVGNVQPVNNTIIPRKGSSDNKPLPDAVIQTLTQRVQHKLNDKKR